MMTGEPLFFATPGDFRAWLEEHHDTSAELLVGFHKKGSGKPSITWPESVDQALCFGWIDGVRRSLGADSYTIRFTPRRQRSVWSAANVKRAQELIELELMRPAGRKAFETRTERRVGVYSYEQARDAAKLDREQENEFRANAAAWEWFERQPPSYRRAATWWVVSAKREETRHRRLAALIEDSAHGRSVAPLRRPPKRT
jgi:uncharacterized protein YdeI (YjbR/CyaY-like superfamily)